MHFGVFSFAMHSFLATSTNNVRSSAGYQEPIRHTTRPIVTGTTVLGVRYQDGVMLASDTLASYGSLARYKDVRRINRIGENTLVAGSGKSCRSCSGLEL